MNEMQFRNKVTWFSFVFSLLVVWVHSYNAELYLGQTAQMQSVYRVEHWIGEGIGQMAVPGFFMISGFLFYRNFTWQQLGKKWRRRLLSVLVPFMLWNFLYYVGYVIGSRLPWIADVVGKGTISFDFHKTADAVLNYTYNYVFWYLFQLIWLILLAPILYPVLKHLWSCMIFYLLLWGLAAAEVSLPLINVDALIYYSFGATLALGRRKQVEGLWSLKRGIGGMGMLAGAILSYRLGIQGTFPAWFVLCRLLMVAGLWVLVPGEKLPKAKTFMCHNFFLYAIHFAFVRFINKAGAQVLPAVPAVPLILYLLMPALALGISTAMGAALRRWVPGVWNILNGRR